MYLWRNQLNTFFFSFSEVASEDLLSSLNILIIAWNKSWCHSGQFHHTKFRYLEKTVSICHLCSVNQPLFKIVAIVGSACEHDRGCSGFLLWTGSGHGGLCNRPHNIIVIRAFKVHDRPQKVNGSYRASLQQACAPHCWGIAGRNELVLLLFPLCSRALGEGGRSGSQSFNWWTDQVVNTGEVFSKVWHQIIFMYHWIHTICWNQLLFGLFIMAAIVFIYKMT